MRIVLAPVRQPSPPRIHIADDGVAQLHGRLCARFANEGVPAMELSDKSARQLFAEIKAKPTRARFGFGRKPALVNIDLQRPTRRSASS